MRSFLRRYRDLVVTGLLLVAPLVVYAAHAGVASTPGPVRRAVVWVTTPVQAVAVKAGALCQDAWYGWLDLRTVRAENRALREENLRLKARVGPAEELTLENARLKRLVDARESAPGLRVSTAAVLGTTVASGHRLLRIARGSDDGVRAGLPVLTPDGVVGRVLEVHARASDVLVLTDPESAIAVIDQRSRTRATARGTGEDGSVRLDYVLKSDDLEEGDVLVTAPSGGLFPKGLRIGRATRVDEAAHGLFKGAQLSPFVDLARLEEVQVVLGEGITAMDGAGAGEWAP